MVQPNSIGFPFNNGAGIGLGFQATTATLAGAGTGQSFNNLPLPNTKLALYTLSIRQPQPPNAQVQTYTFPLSPAAISKSYMALSNIFDVAGSAQQNGVQRVIDTYGNTPVTYVLQGTTGWQYHGTDGFSLTGLESIAEIQKALNRFAQLNKQQQVNNQTQLYLLEFYDFFANEFWQVVPVGPQVIQQNAQRPLLFDYSFRLAGVKDLSAPNAPTVDDPVLNAFSQTGQQAVTSLSSNISGTLNNYASYTAGSLGVGA